MRLVLVGLIAIAAACGGTPTAPSSTPPASTPPVTVAPPPVGTLRSWSGTFQTLGCQSGNCGAATGDFAIRLIDRGSIVEGLFLLKLDEAYYRLVVSTVSGTRDGSGTMMLNGSVNYRDSSTNESSFQISLQVSESGGGLIGSARYAFGGGSFRDTRDVRILFARETTSSGASQLSGTWQGYLSLDACAGNCPSSSWGFDSLLLAQVGTQVSGSTGLVEVHGTFSAATLTLSGARSPDPTCHSSSYIDSYCMAEVQYSAQLDKFDRLSGTMTEKVSYYPEKSQTRVDYEATYSFTTFVRWP